ncbi:MAG: sigma-70 family RNA polymerase sigma factor [Defluviitaleaceae bacterium]|nr:sigma-70 family RNA polymerase sigma factor [Defluviitaleaceae bacterium]
MSAPNITTRFEDIYNSTQKLCLTFITAKCKRTADVADIFQDTYVELYKVMKKHGTDYVDNHEAFVLWLAKKKLAKYYSMLTRLSIFISTKTRNEKADIYEQEDEAFASEDFAVNHAILESAKKFIESQPEVVQKIFYLHYELDLTLREIAEALEMNESTVKSRLYRSLKELRKVLS